MHASTSSTVYSCATQVTTLQWQLSASSVTTDTLQPQEPPHIVLLRCPKTCPAEGGHIAYIPFCRHIRLLPDEHPSTNNADIMLCQHASQCLFLQAPKQEFMTPQSS